MSTAQALATTLLPAVPGRRPKRPTIEADRITATPVAARPHAACPACGRSSRSMHSRYYRTAADLPRGGRAMRLHLAVLGFFCRSPGCPRQIFTERLPSVVEPDARRTTRLADGLRRPGDRTEAEAAALDPLTRLAPAIGRMLTLGEGSLELLRDRRGEAARDRWVSDAEASASPELRRFAVKLQQDLASVRAAWSQARSNGPTEGRVHT
jgi:transposase